MTEGSILGHLIRFSLPLLLGNLFQQLYNTVDSIVVGNFVSKEALAAVGSTGSIINMVVSMTSGLSIGATVVIAQYYGARDHKNLHDAVHTTMLATLISSTVFIGVGVALVGPMLRFMRTPEDVFGEASTYLTIYFLGRDCSFIICPRESSARWAIRSVRCIFCASARRSIRCSICCL